LKRHAAIVIGAERDRGDVGDPHRVAVQLGDDDGRELLGLVEVAARPHGELAAVPLDAARRDLGVARPQRTLDVADGEAVGGETLRVDPHAHGVAARGADEHRAHALDALQALGQDVLGGVGQLEQVVALAVQRQPDDRLRVDVDLGDDRILGGERELAADAGDAVAHVVGRVLDVAV
jgi:hypothetical protein